MKAVKHKGRITAETVASAKALYDNLPKNMRKASKIAEMLGISAFTVGMIAKAGFDYEKYKSVVSEWWQNAKLKTKKEVEEVEVKPEVSNADPMLVKMDLLIDAVNRLVEAWVAKPY